MMPGRLAKTVSVQSQALAEEKAFLAFEIERMEV